MIRRAMPQRFFAHSPSIPSWRCPCQLASRPNWEGARFSQVHVSPAGPPRIFFSSCFFFFFVLLFRILLTHILVGAGIYVLCLLLTPYLCTLCCCSLSLHPPLANGVPTDDENNFLPAGSCRRCHTSVGIFQRAGFHTRGCRGATCACCSSQP